MTRFPPGHVAVVTGAARELAARLQKIFLERGSRVAVIDHDRDELESAFPTASGGNEDVSVHVCDVSDSGSVFETVETLARIHGRIDVLVNNAAIADETPLAQLSEDRLNRVMDVNFESALHCVKSCLPHMRKAGGGSIVNVASTQGFRGQPNTLAYSAAKAALIALTRSLCRGSGPEGIRVNAVAPGFINTRMAIQPDGQHEHQTEWFRDVYLKHGRLPLRRPGEPGDSQDPLFFWPATTAGISPDR